MKILITLVAIIGLTFCGFLAINAGNANLAGHWLGTLNANGVPLRVGFHINKRWYGLFSATMDSLDQGVKGIPVTIVSAQPESILFRVDKVAGAFQGKFEKGKLTGRWKQGPGSFPLTLEQAGASGPKPSDRQVNPESIEANEKTGGRLVGTWEGSLRAGPSNFRLLFKIAKTSDGGLLGTIDSLDQGASDISITAIRYHEPTIELEIKTIGGLFEAELESEGTALNGDWTQGGNTIPLRLTKKN